MGNRQPGIALAQLSLKVRRYDKEFINDENLLGQGVADREKGLSTRFSI